MDLDKITFEELAEGRKVKLLGIIDMYDDSDGMLCAKILHDYMKEHGPAKPIPQEIIDSIKDDSFLQEFRFEDNLFKDYGNT